MIYASLVNCEVYLGLRDATIMLDGEPTPINGVLGIVESAGPDFLRIQVRAIADGAALYEGETPTEVTLHVSSITLAQLIEEGSYGEEDEDEEDEDGDA